jgi:hypothetical protein
MKAFANDHGRKELYPFTMGIIKSVMSDKSYTADEKVLQIERTLSLLDTVWNDESLPWRYEDTEKALLQESLEENELLNGSTETWSLEDILRREA